jgi:hypothetical protein
MSLKDDLSCSAHNHVRNMSLHQLKQLAHSGVVFVGDSVSRRMYVRMVGHLEGIDLSNEQLAKDIQNYQKNVTKRRRDKLDALSFDAASVVPLLSQDLRYTGSGNHSGQYDRRYVFVEKLAKDHISNRQWMKELPSWGTAVVAFTMPFLHELYNPAWDTPILLQSALQVTI